MFKIIGGITNIILGLAALLFLSDSIKSYFGGNEQKILALEQLIENGVEIKAKLNDDWEEVEVSIKAIKVTIYTAKYQFEVDSIMYGGKFRFNEREIPETDSIPVIYLPEDPTQNEADAETKLDEAIEQLESNEDIWKGLIAITFCVVMVLWGVWKIKKGLKQLKPSRE